MGTGKGTSAQPVYLPSASLSGGQGQPLDGWEVLGYNTDKTIVDN